MTALLVLLVVAAAILYVSTAAVLVGPAKPPSGPEAWVADDRERGRPGSGR